MEAFWDHLKHEFTLPLGNEVLMFSLILFIILLSPILLKRLNIPGLIGLVISGVVIGPHGLDIIEKNAAVDLFSTIGLLYIMFIAGLELDLNDFRRHRVKSVWFGFLTFILPIASGFPVCYYLLGMDFNASLLTAAMFATHTLVAYPIVSRMGIAKNPAVAITVGGTILTDTAVLMILAVILGRHEGSLNQAFWIQLSISLTVYTVFVFTIIPRVAKWFFSALESEKHSHYIFVLSAVFFAAFLAEVAGLEPIIGAFLAGLALNRLIPHSSALMNRIEFIGSSLFIPFFLISVGMLVDVRVILSGPTALIIAGVLTAVGLIGKWLAAWITQLVFKYTAAQRGLIYGLSSARAAATLTVVLVGYDAGILDETILNGTIILILITCIVSSFVTERAAKEILLTSEEDTAPAKEELTKKPEHILLPLANIANFSKLLELALLIRDKSSLPSVSLLTVVPNNEEAEVNILKSRSKLEEFVREASAMEAKVNVLATIDHNVASGITRTVREVMADLLIIGWPSRTGMIQKLIGEKVESIVSNTDRVVFVCELVRPLVLHKSMLIYVPELAERENGFERWVKKIGRLGQELSASAKLFASAETLEAIQAIWKAGGFSIPVTKSGYQSVDSFVQEASKASIDELVILVSSRRGFVSHSLSLDQAAMRLDRQAEAVSKIVIYPQQRIETAMLDVYDDVSAEPLNRSLETIERIGKGIGDIFRRDKDDKDDEERGQ
ncbi:MAG: cation:proton antiporter [Bacteroidetes bacterium]|nr:cation:proton antiporter [Bacteroidota bacterium]